MERSDPARVASLKVAPESADDKIMPMVPSQPEAVAFQTWLNSNRSTAWGKWVALCGDVVDGPHPTRLEAHRAGFRRFGRQQIFIRQAGAPTRPDEEIY